MKHFHAPPPEAQSGLEPAAGSPADAVEVEAVNGQPVEPDDEAIQDEYRRRFFEQMRRLDCPGCGDDGLFF